MSIKIKLTAIAIAFTIALSTMIVGVLAITNSNLTFTGNIGFVTSDAEVFLHRVKYQEGDYEGYEIELTEYSNTYLTDSFQITLPDRTLYANSGKTYLFLDMTSLMSDRYVKVQLSYTKPSGVIINSTSLFLDKNPTESALHGESATYKIIMENEGSSSVNLSSINLTISFITMDSLIQFLSPVYYVEMGTIPTDTGSEYIKWRYISADGVTPYEFGTSTAPTGSPGDFGYFVLYTSVASCSFNNDYIVSGNYAYHQLYGLQSLTSFADDYALSTIRHYINGDYVLKSFQTTSATTRPYGDYSSMYADFNIDIENDLIYKKIIGRTLGDLYQENVYNQSSGTYTTTSIPDTTNADDAYKCDESTVDKFWLLSRVEAINLLSPSLSWNANYWLRSPFKASSSPDYLACMVQHTTGMGAYVSNAEVKNEAAARPAFRMQF